MNTSRIQAMVGAYLSVRHEKRTLTASEAAGFLLTQFGVFEVIVLIEDKGIQKTSEYWNDVLTELRTTISGD